MRPFFGLRLDPRAAEIAARVEDEQRGNLPVPPKPPPRVGYCA